MLLVALSLALAAPVAASRDPFAAFAVSDANHCAVEAANVAACAPVDDLAVTAILTGTTTPRALVTVSGGQSVVLRVGDLLAGGRITRIRRDAVIVERIAFSNVGPASRTLVTLSLGH
jgi:hypothetical protein